MEKIEFIISEFQKCNIELSQDKADKLLKLYEFLVEYNQNVNLTAITDFEEVVVKHFIDSVLPFSMIDIKENSSFIDVGTGAGFPSIPLMIVRPDLKGTLLEALNKRCVFLEKACELTGVVQRWFTAEQRTTQKKSVKRLILQRQGLLRLCRYFVSIAFLM